MKISGFRGPYLVKINSEEYGSLKDRFYIDQELLIEGTGTLHDKAQEYLVNEWVANRGAQMLVLLAPAGHGKSTLMRSVAKLLLAGTRTLPLLIPFQRYRRLVTYRALLHEFFQDHSHPTPGEDAVNVLLKYGLAVLMLDGFDELCEQAGNATARDNLKVMAKGVTSGGKILLTSRTAFFRSEIEGEAMVREAFPEGQLAIGELQRFDRPRRNKLVELYARPERRNHISKVLDALPENDDLASSPLVITKICEMDSQGTGAIHTFTNVADVYRLLLERHCEREVGKQGFDAVKYGPPKQIELLKLICQWRAELGANDEKQEQMSLDESTISYVIENWVNEQDAAADRAKKETDGPGGRSSVA